MIAAIPLDSLAVRASVATDWVLETSRQNLNVQGKGTSGDWSSFIGIITAVVGNILISFALNTQRYAHVRLAKEQEEEKDEESGQYASRETNEQAAAEVEVAEQRSRENARSDTSRVDLDHDLEGREGSETDALIPHIEVSGFPKTAQDNGNGSKQEHATHDEDEDNASHDEGPKRKNYLRSPYWWLGITLMTVGEAGNFLAYGFAPASIVSPLGVVALITNCLVAPLMLGENFRRRDLLGVVIAVGGAVTVVLSAQGSNPKLGPDEILDMIKRWEFLTYMGITVAVIIVLMVLSNRYGSRSILIDLGLVGLFGGYTALSTKGVASLLSYRLFRALTFPIFYVLVAVLVGTAVLQIKYVNRALQRFDSTRVIPTQFCIFTIFVIVGSAILYRDFEKTTAGKAGMFVGGCALTFVGVWFLTSGRRSGDDDNDAQTHAHKAHAEDDGRIDLVDDEESALDTRGGATTPKATAGGSMNSTSTSTTGTTANQSFRSALSSRPQMHTAATTPSPLLLQHQRAASTGATEFSPLLQPSTPSSSSAAAKQRHPSTPTPDTPRSDTLSPTRSTPGARTPLVSRASISRLGFGTSGLGPLTSPLSSGLSVVIADQRGRLARGASRRDVGEARRPSAPQGSETEGALGTRVSERPRVGRGTTVEVAGSSSPALGRDGGEASGGGGGR